MSFRKHAATGQTQFALKYPPPSRERFEPSRAHKIERGQFASPLSPHPHRRTIQAVAKLEHEQAVGVMKEIRATTLNDCSDTITLTPEKAQDLKQALNQASGTKSSGRGSGLVLNRPREWRSNTEAREYKNDPVQSSSAWIESAFHVVVHAVRGSNN